MNFNNLINTGPETDWFGKWAMYAPDSIALQWEDGGKKFTYRECNERINRMASMFSGTFGIRKGDRVAVLSQNSIDYVLLFFALQKCGAILVPLNFRLTAEELDWPLQDSDPSLLLYENQYTEKVLDLKNRAKRTLPVDGPSGFYQLLEDFTDTPKPFEYKSNFEDPCMILYTSGTTGKPKGAVITPKMIFWNSVNTGLRLNLTQSDVTITFAPFFHTGGWNVLTTPFLHRGAKLILSNKFEPEAVLRLCDKENVSILFGVPTMMDMMHRAENFKTVDLSSVRYAIVGGEPMPVKLIEEWHKKGVPIRQGYGLTEFGPNVFSLNEQDAILKIGSVGFPNFYIRTRIVDDKGNDTAPGEPGELLLKGPACMAGYWNNEKATNATIQDGWLYTGDIVRKDEDGFFYIVDRKKDMYISGAENVYPAEVEHVLRRCDGVRDAAVIGVPDEKWGEAGMAFIIPENKDLNQDAILDFCRGKLAKYKIPKHVRFVDAFPTGDSGKILKRKLRDEYQ